MLKDGYTPMTTTNVGKTTNSFTKSTAFSYETFQLKSNTRNNTNNQWEI
jgi:hypothetical protein